MKPSIQSVYQQIHFIERDIELHKQIAASIPSANSDELQETVEKIAAMKQQLIRLKESIADIDPVEYQSIQRLEQATARFKELAAEKTLTQVYTLDQCRQCTLAMTDGRLIDCLVIAGLSSGDWLVLTLAGECCQFMAADVQLVQTTAAEK